MMSLDSGMHWSQMLEPPCHLQDSALKWCARNLNLLKFLNTCLSKSLYVQVGGDRKWRTSRTTLRTPTPLVIRHCFLVYCARTWKISFPLYLQMSETQIANEFLHGNREPVWLSAFSVWTLHYLAVHWTHSRLEQTSKFLFYSSFFPALGAFLRGDVGDLTYLLLFLHFLMHSVSKVFTVA